MENVPFKLMIDQTNGTRSLIRIGDLARSMGYSRQHLTRLCRSGKVPGARVTRGGHWRVFTSKQLARWVAIRAPQAVKTNSQSSTHVHKLVIEEYRLKAVATVVRRLLAKNQRERIAHITHHLSREEVSGTKANHASPSARVTSSM
jgi:hypothetical protein